MTFSEEYKRRRASATFSWNLAFKPYDSNMFKCSVCDKSFGRLANLQRHERNLHSNSAGPANERPSTSSTTNLDNRPCFNELVDDDAIFEHGREVLECEGCAMFFLDQEHLDCHEKVYHNSLKNVRNTFERLSRLIRQSVRSFEYMPIFFHVYELLCAVAVIN